MWIRTSGDKRPPSHVGIARRASTYVLSPPRRRGNTVRLPTIARQVGTRVDADVPRGIRIVVSRSAGHVGCRFHVRSEGYKRWIRYVRAMRDQHELRIAVSGICDAARGEGRDPTSAHRQEWEVSEGGGEEGEPIGGERWSERGREPTAGKGGRR